MEDAAEGTGRWPPARYYVKVTATVVLTLVVAYAMYRARSMLVLIFLGFFLAVGFDPMIQRLERRGIRRGFSVLGFAVLVVGLLVGLAFVVVAPAAREITEFVDSIPEYVQRLERHLRGTSLGDYLEQESVQQKIQSGVSSVLTQSAGGVLGLVGGVISAIFTAVTLFVLTVYFMLALPRLRRRFDRMLETDERRAVLDESFGKVGGYVTGQLGICLCAGVSSYIVLTILSAPYPALLAIVVTLLDAIPQVGATIGAVVAVLVALTASVPVAIAVLIFFVAYQQLENYVIAPRVFSHTIAMTPLASLLSVLIGASLAGVVGAIVALPLTAAGAVVVRNSRAAGRLTDGDIPEDPEKR